MRDFWWVAIILALLALAVAIGTGADEKCHQKGGVMVRGVVGYECVKAARVQ